MTVKNMCGSSIELTDDVKKAIICLGDRLSELYRNITRGDYYPILLKIIMSEKEETFTFSFKGRLRGWININESTISKKFPLRTFVDVLGNENVICQQNEIIMNIEKVGLFEKFTEYCAYVAREYYRGILKNEINPLKNRGFQEFYNNQQKLEKRYQLYLG